MKMNPRISVILPIYNVEPYLRQCVDSIGLLGHEDVEIILVNDGSTDGSPEICAEYAQKWNNVILINKANGGLSDARNWGTEAAKGDFIYYLDSDDWLAPDAIEILYRFAQENNCEVVQGGFYYAFPDYLEFDDRWLKDDDKPFVLNREDAMLNLMRNRFVKNFAWGRLYKAEIAKKYQFPFGKYFEDSYWQHLIINEINRYGVIPAPLYYYRQRRDSISGRSGKKILDLFRGLEEQLAFVSKHYPNLTGIVADKIWLESYSYRNWDKEFHDQFIRIDAEYTPLLTKKFRNSVYYHLAKRDSRLLPFYQLYIKVKNRLCYKRLKRIELT